MSKKQKKQHAIHKFKDKQKENLRMMLCDFRVARQKDLVSISVYVTRVSEALVGLKAFAQSSRSYSARARRLLILAPDA